MSTSKKSAEALRSYHGFEVLRLLCALGVIFSHSYATVGKILEEPIWNIVPGMFNVATASVGGFFAISGFLVTRSFLARAGSARGVSAFVMSRALRIFPALLVCLMVSIVLGSVLTSLSQTQYWSSSQTWEYLWRNALLGRVNTLPGVFANNPAGNGVNGSIWTIPLEVSMYCATLLFGVLTVWQRRWSAALVALLLVAWCYVAPSTFVFFPLNERIAVYAVSCYAIGTIWAVWNVTQARTLMISLALALLFVLLYRSALDQDLIRLVAFAAIAVAALYVGRLQWAWMGVATRFGDLSYGMFLYSSPIQQTLVWVHPGISLPLLLVCSVVLSAIAALLSWHLIEKYALRFKGGVQRLPSA